MTIAQAEWGALGLRGYLDNTSPLVSSGIIRDSPLAFASNI